MFLWTWGCTTFNSIPRILILLTNKYMPLIYSVTICQQKTKDWAPIGSFQHNTAAPLFLYLMFVVFHNQSPLITMWLHKHTIHTTDTIDETFRSLVGCYLTRGTQQSFTPEGSALRSNSSPFYIPLLTEQVPLLYVSHWITNGTWSNWPVLICWYKSLKQEVFFVRFTRSFHPLRHINFCLILYNETMDTS